MIRSGAWYYLDDDVEKPVKTIRRIYRSVEDLYLYAFKPEWLVEHEDGTQEWVEERRLWLIEEMGG